LVSEGRIQKVADFCKTDALDTYHIWLLWEVFHGGLAVEQLDQNEAKLCEHILRRTGDTVHHNNTIYSLLCSLLFPAALPTHPITISPAR